MSIYRNLSHLAFDLYRLVFPTCLYLIKSVQNPSIIRFFPAWFLSNLDPRRSPFNDEKPWVTFAAQKWLYRNVHSEMQIFEYGSGGSTLFFSRRAKKVVSIESDRNFHQTLSKLLNDKKILNCEYSLREPEPAGSKVSDASDPHGYASSEIKGVSFESYVKSLEAYPDNSFDLIFIDGRARPSCILQARGKVRPGGYLVLDNSERPHYERAQSLLDGWTRIDLPGPGPYGRYFWQTSIWGKAPALPNP